MNEMAEVTLAVSRLDASILTVKLAVMAVFVGLSAVGCGSRTALGDVGGADAGALDGHIPDSFEELAPPETSVMTGDGEAEEGVTCKQVGQNAFENGERCAMSTVEECSDGIDYEASCSCQAGKCFCQINANPPKPGQSNTTVPLPIACSPSCAITAEQALRLCGYPTT
jgi:hypothetical protein